MPTIAVLINAVIAVLSGFLIALFSFQVESGYEVILLAVYGPTLLYGLINAAVFRIIARRGHSLLVTVPFLACGLFALAVSLRIPHYFLLGHAIINGALYLLTVYFTSRAGPLSGD